MKKLLNSLGYVASIYLTAIVFFSAFRVALFCACGGFAEAGRAEGGVALAAQAFVWGFRFDTVTTLFVLALPLVAAMAGAFFAAPQGKVFRAVQIWCSALFVPLLFLSAANIPYFANFSKTINGSVLNWLDEPAFVWGMVSAEFSFALCGLAFAAVAVGFCWILNFLRKRFARRSEAFPPVARGAKSLAAACAVCVVVAVLVFAGMRGRLASSPIRIGTAYFCSEPFFNELGLNPGFVFIKTTQDTLRERGKGVRLMDPARADAIVRAYLGTEGGASPIARVVPAKPGARKKNVVLVMMEAMSYDFIERGTYTPNLNALAEKSLAFPRAFSAGIHTVNGLYACSFGFPALLAQHPFKVTSGFARYDGLAETLRANGYTTYFITSQDDQFDNAGGYLRANGIEKVISYNDYPRETILSKLGPPDDYAMRFSVPILTKDQAETGKPFFAYYMTTCNHAPRVIPDYFSPRSSDEVEQTVELTDYAVGVFLEKASREPWFKDTIFVFTGDHGMCRYGSIYDEALPAHHVPLIIYTPDDETKRVNENMAGQIDIFPTVMGMLGLGYVNDSFGVDLLAETRPYIFYSSDYSVVALDREWFYVKQLTTKKESLFRWAENDVTNRIDDEPERARKMREYAEAMIQTAQEEVRKRLEGGRRGAE